METNGRKSYVRVALLPQNYKLMEEKWVQSY